MATINEPYGTTNGARSHGIFETCIAWLPDIVAGRPLSIEHLDALCGHAGAPDFHASLSDVFATMEIDLNLVPEVVGYVVAKTSNPPDFKQIVATSRRLLTSGGPFAVKPKAGLPIPAPFVADPPRREHRLDPVVRAQQLINQHSLSQFDPANATRYMEWRCELLGVCELDDDDRVKLQLVFNSMTTTLMSTVRNVLHSELSAAPAILFNSILAYLDSQFKNLRSIRHIESGYLNCRMQSGESLQSYHARFARCARLYERAKDIKLSDTEMILVFGSGLDKQYQGVCTLVETTCPCTNFNDFSQRVIYLADSQLSAFSMNSIDLNIQDVPKRPRLETTHGPHRSRGFGCFRCKQGNHMASNCPNAVQDLEKRCRRCGSHKHKIEACPVILKSNCPRCGGPHMASVCTSPLSNIHKARLPIPNNAMSFDALHGAVVEAANQVVSIVDCSSLDLVDSAPPMIDTFIGSSQTPLQSLIDSGAAASFIGPEVVLQLSRNKNIDPSDLYKLDPPVRVRFGNGTTGESESALKVRVKLPNKEAKSCDFIVFPGLAPNLILGRPAIRAFDLMPPLLSSTDKEQPRQPQIATVEIDHFAAWIEPVPPEVPISIHHHKSLSLRFKMMEDILMEPLREPMRSFSPRNERILLDRLVQMAHEGSIRECSLHELRVVVPPVLVDKKKDSMAPRIYPDPDIHRRYRVTLDLRGVNEMRLYCDAASRFALIGKTLSTIGKNANGIEQFQHSSFNILRRMPMDKLGAYSKIDIQDAFGCVRLHEKLRFFGTEIYCADSGKHRYFLWNSLVQGWRYSPTFFRMVANYLLEVIRGRTGNFDVHMDFYQDDLVLAANASQVEALASATDIAIRTLQEYGFRVRPDKCSVAVQSITFCGYSLTGTQCKPSPSRRIFSESLKAKLWNDLSGAYPETTGVLQWTRSVSGMFQYLYGFLGAPELKALQDLHRYVSGLNKGSLPSLEDLKAAFELLIDYAIHGLPSLFLGSFASQKTVYSICLTDANTASWCGILLKAIVADRSDTVIGDPPEDPFSLIRKTLMTCECIPENQTLIFFPVRIFGGKFDKTVQKLSSTFRERVAQLLFIEEAAVLIEGKCFSISDNRNCQQVWHSCQEQFGGKLLLKWQLFLQTVDEILWLPRQDLPTLADYIARQIDAADAVVDCHSAVQMSSRDLLIDTIRAGYAHTTDSYMGIPLKDIYNCFCYANGATDDEKLQKALKFFCYDTNVSLMYFLSGTTPRLFIPDIMISIEGKEMQLRSYVISLAHIVQNTHHGQHRTICNLEKVWWGGINNAVESFIRSCWTCLTSRSLYVKNRVANNLSSIAIHTKKPFELLCLDHFYLDASSDTTTFKYVLVVCDAYSNFVFGKLCKTMDAISTAEYLLELFGFVGIPTGIHSDQGSAFQSLLMIEVSRLLSIKQTFSPAGFPRANGIAEACVKSVKGFLKNLLRHSPEIALPTATMMHNTCVNYRTGFTPFEAVFGFTRPTLSDLQMDGLNSMCSHPFSRETQLITRRAFELVRNERHTHTINDSVMQSPIIQFQSGDICVIVRKKTQISSDDTLLPHVLLHKVGVNIWKVSRLDTPQTFDVPESLLKAYVYSPQLENIPECCPPESLSKPNPLELRLGDVIVAKLPERHKCMLIQVQWNNTAEESISGFKLSRNRLNQFHVERNSIPMSIPYGDIIVKIKLRHRQLPPETTRLVALLLGRGDGVLPGE